MNKKYKWKWLCVKGRQNQFKINKQKLKQYKSLRRIKVAIKPFKKDIIQQINNLEKKPRRRRMPAKRKKNQSKMNHNKKKEHYEIQKRSLTPI